MTVSAGSVVIASDYDTLRTRIANEAARRSIGVPYTPDFAPGTTIGAATFNSYITALSALNTLGTALTLPGYKVAGQSVVTAWEAAILFSAMTTLEGQQLACRFARNTVLSSLTNYMDYANMWTGMGADGNTDGWSLLVKFSIDNSNNVTIYDMELWAWQLDGGSDSGLPSGCNLSHDGRYHATAAGGALAASLGFAGYATCDTSILSKNLYISGGKEHLDIKWRYGLTYMGCYCYAPRWIFNLTAECNGTITPYAQPDVQYTPALNAWTPYDIFAVPNCTVPPAVNNYYGTGDNYYGTG